MVIQVNLRDTKDIAIIQAIQRADAAGIPRSVLVRQWYESSSKDMPSWARELLRQQREILERLDSGITLEGGVNGKEDKVDLGGLLRMYNLFDLLSIFDWISPLWNTYKDVLFWINDGSATWTIWLNKDDLGLAQKVLRDKSIKVISTTTVALDQEAGLTVKKEQINLVITLLNGVSIETW